MYSPEKVLAFINSFKVKYPEAIEDTFYNGHCYWFAHILAARFKGDIWFNPVDVHFAAKICNNLYDVYGLIKEDGNWVSWHRFQVECREAVDKVIATCIKKEK